MFFRRELLLSLGIILGSILIASLVFGWFFEELKTQAAAAQTLRQEHQEHLAAVETLFKLRDESAVAGQYEKKLHGLLPAYDDLINFSQWLDGLAQPRRLTTHFNFASETGTPAPEAPGQVGFSLELAGASSSIFEVLRTLEINPSYYLLRLDNFDFQLGAEATRFVGQGKLFFRPSPAASSAAPSK